jgi:hypothetical protein
MAKELISGEFLEESKNKELFKPLKKLFSETGRELDFGGRYLVGNMGTIIALPKTIGKRKMSGFICSARPTSTNHLQIQLLTKEGEGAFVYVHRLVASVWLKRKKRQTDVMHLDDNPLNNNVENIRWCTHLENMQDKVRKGRHAKTIKYSNALCMEVYRQRELGKSLAEIDSLYPNISKGMIRHMTSGKVLRDRKLI